MKIPRTALVFLLIATLLQSCATTHSVYKVGDGNPEGIHYSLPRTVVKVSVPVKKVIFSPGRYARFARPLLGKKAKQSASISHVLQGDVQAVLATRAEADPNHVYSVKIGGGPLQTRLMLLELSELGLLSHARAEVEDMTVDFAVAAVEVATKLAIGSPGAGAPGFAGATIQPEKALGLQDRLDKMSRLLLKRSPGNPKPTDWDAITTALNGTPKTLRIDDAETALSKVAIKDSKWALLKSATLSTLIAGAHDIKDPTRANEVLEIVQDTDRRVILLGEQGTVATNAESAITRDLNLLVSSKPTQGTTFFRGTPIDTITVTDSTGVTKTYSFVNPTITQKIFDFVEEVVADGLAVRIKDIEQSKLTLLFADANPGVRASAEGTKTLLEAIEAEGKSHKQQFFGTSKEVKWTAQLEVDPGDGPCECESGFSDIPLFALSKNEGVLLNGKGNLKNSDRGLFITHRYLSSTQSPQVVLRLNCNVDNQLGGVVAAHGTPQRTKNRTGFYYRVPVMVESTLMLQIPGAIYTSSIDGERGTPITPHPVLAYSALSIPQWGPARYLPRRTGS